MVFGDLAESSFSCPLDNILLYMAEVLREREEGNQLWKIVGFRRQFLNIRAPIPSLHNVFLFYSFFLQYRVSTAHMVLYKDLKGSLETFTDERTHINLP